MIFFVVIAFAVVVPFVELWVVIRVGQWVGFVPTLAALFAISVLGSSVVKHEGLKVYRDFVGAISRGEVPSREIVHGVCVLVAGVFLLAPGFITDVLAVLLLLPPVRAAATTVVLRRSTRRVTVRRSGWTASSVDVRGDIASRSGEIIDVRPRDEGNDDD